MGSEDFVMAGKLSLAAMLGGLVGLEREMHHQTAGLRTHMIVAVGACLVMLTSLHMADMSPTKADPGRLAAQVVAGVGFLGAGAIMRSGLSIRGLTTAACLWTVAAVGLAVGCGFWKAASMATVLVLLATYFFQKVENRISKGRYLRRFVVHARESASLVADLEDTLRKSGCTVRELDIERNIVDKKMQVSITASCPEDHDVDKLSRSFGALSDVERVEID
ncbi:MAG TPA: MgtC/SapB family protein [Planctomycetota bacterium]|nr:MgtC/SapB family protein [Planctomycetota bacterium]